MALQTHTARGGEGKGQARGVGQREKRQRVDNKFHHCRQSLEICGSFPCISIKSASKDQQPSPLRIEPHTTGKLTSARCFLGMSHPLPSPVDMHCVGSHPELCPLNRNEQARSAELQQAAVRTSNPDSSHHCKGHFRECERWLATWQPSLKRTCRKLNRDIFPTVSRCCRLCHMG